MEYNSGNLQFSFKQKFVNKHLSYLIRKFCVRKFSALLAAIERFVALNARDDGFSFLTNNKFEFNEGADERCLIRFFFWGI